MQFTAKFDVFFPLKKQIRHLRLNLSKIVMLRNDEHQTGVSFTNHLCKLQSRYNKVNGANNALLFHQHFYSDVVACFRPQLCIGHILCIGDDISNKSSNVKLNINDVCNLINISSGQFN